MKENKTRIHVQELRIGMFVTELDVPWEKSPFADCKASGLIIQSREQLAQLRRCSTYVFIDADKQKKMFGAIPTAASKETDRVAFQKAFTQAANTYGHTSQIIKNLLGEMRFGGQLDTETAEAAVADCVNSVLDNSDSMQLLTQLKNMDEYYSQHCLNTCVLSILLGKHLKFPEEKLKKLGLCGLLHDIGMSKIPPEIINKEGELLGKELAIMRNHPLLGKEILQAAGNVDPEAIEVAYAHHERLDGSGYPRGLVRDEISAFSKIIAIVDSYDAITSDRIYQHGKLHIEALEILISGRKTHYDENLVMQFIECVGIYPVGSPVEMRSGEVVMVIESNPQEKTKPIVLQLLDANKQAVPPKLLNLADPALRDNSGKPYKLARVIKRDSYGLNLPEYHDIGDLSSMLLIEEAE